MIRAAPGRGLELQHEAPVILERVNRYYGYGAVSQIRINQGSSPPKTWSSPSSKAPQQPVRPLSGIADEALQAALERLGGNIAAAGGLSTRAKE